MRLPCLRPVARHARLGDGRSKLEPIDMSLGTPLDRAYFFAAGSVMPEDPEIQPGSPEYENLRREVMRLRRQERDDLTLALIKHADAYKAELTRDDPAHSARLIKRRDALYAVVEQLADALLAKDVTPDEIELANRMRRTRGEGGQ